MEEGYKIKKYPRTPHLAGSRLQPGDEDLTQIDFNVIKGKHLVIEEKIDGANTAISFDVDGTLLLQSRGHYLRGGAREAHYALFKQWASVHATTFFDALDTRYIMYGEWMYAKHRMYYDALPSYFMEFDIFDRENGVFLDTPSRRKITEKMPICSVAVLKEGVFPSIKEITKCFAPSHYVTDRHLENLREYCEQNGIDFATAMQDTDNTDIMEGLYVKVEENGCVVDRMKFVRNDFYQGVKATTNEWFSRRTIPNQLSPNAKDMFSE